MSSTAYAIADSPGNNETRSANAVELGYFHTGDTIDSFLKSIQSESEISSATSSQLERLYAWSPLVHKPILITTMSQDNSIVVSSISYSLFGRYLSNAGLDPSHLSKQGRVLAAIYGNIPDGIDIYIWEDYQGKMTYFSAILPATSYELIFDPSVGKVLSKSYGEKFAQFAQNKAEHSSAFYPPYPSPSEPHASWLEVGSNEEIEKLLSALSASFELSAFPTIFNHFGIDLNSNSVALPISELFSIYRTVIINESITHTELTPDELLDEVNCLTRVVVGVFALKDGRIQILMIDQDQV